MLALAGVVGAPHVSIQAQVTPSGRNTSAIATLDAATRRDVVDTMAARLRQHYVDADTGTLIAEHLKKRLASGAYDAITSPARFAELLTDELRAVNDDRHLRVIYSPDNTGLRPGPEGIRMFGGPPGGGRGSPPPTVLDAARQAHWNLGRVEVLPGNVGYMDIRGFSGARTAEPAIVAALRYLEGTDAIIFDVRRNGGGSPMSVNLIISHFVGADTVASLTVQNRSGHETFTRYTLADVSGPRRPTVPLYVLTSSATASAAEDFTFVLQNLKRATIVGARTAGAGHNNAVLDVGHGFGMSVSFTRVMDPRTKKEWERVGVQPDVVVDQARALDVAHALALKDLVGKEPDARRKRLLELTRETVDAQANPRAVPAGTLAMYAGEYEGGRAVAVENGRLTYSPRPGIPPETLVALSDTSFALGAARLVFERSQSGASQIRVVPPEGEALTYSKVQ